MIPINVDVNARLKEFESSRVLYVTSIFYTIQGEGPFTGCPCIFLRLAGCNYGSKTNVCMQCDTAFQLSNASQYTVEELRKEIEAIAEQHDCYSLVVTGGEPTLQPLLKEFLFDWLTVISTKSSSLESFVQIETNGSIPSFYEDAAWTKIKGMVYVVCSPKVNEVTKKYLKISPTVVQNVQAFKFLVSADPESPYYQVPTLLDLITSYGASDIAVYNDKKYYVSPISVYKKAPDGEVACIFDQDLIDQEATRKNYAYAAEIVLALPKQYQLSLQTHLFTALP